MSSELRNAVALWSDPSPPNDFCHYDHCSAKALFGTMRIEWKSWKDYPNYCLYFDAGETFIGSFDSLDRAKEHAAAVIEADREAVRAYWYRQGKDDGWQMCKENEIDRLREELAEAYIKLSGKSIHTSDCATSNAPAMEPGPCNCDAPGDADLIDKLRDTDSYYRIQEKHWCIDGEELERQRLAAAALIETQAAELAKYKALAETLAGALPDDIDLFRIIRAAGRSNAAKAQAVYARLSEALREYKEATNV